MVKLKNLLLLLGSWIQITIFDRILRESWKLQFSIINEQDPSFKRRIHLFQFNFYLFFIPAKPIKLIAHDP